MTSDYYFLEVDGGNLNMQIVSIGGSICEDAPVGGCLDPDFDTYNPDADYDNGQCENLCSNATASDTAQVADGQVSAPWSYVSANAEGNGAFVTFTSDGADMNYVVADCDSTILNSFFPEGLTVDLLAGQNLYFQAVESFGNTDVETLTATVNEIPDSSEWGCMEEFACNYDSTATYAGIECEYPTAPYDCNGDLLGCTDPTACNYVDTATVGDPTELCSYPPLGSDCEGNCVDAVQYTIDMFDSYGDGWNSASYTFTSDGAITASGTLLTSFAGGNGSDQTDTVCIVADGCYELAIDQGTYGEEMTWFLYNELGEEVLAQSTPYDIADDNVVHTYVFGAGCVTACTDTLASNYDADADISDNSLCTYDYVIGCTDEAACNYDADAEVDNGSCEFPPAGFDCVGGCVDANASVEYFTTNSTLGAYGLYGAVYTVTNSDGDTVMTGAPQGVTFAQDSACLVAGCYNVDVTAADCCDDSDYWSWTFGNVTGPTNSSFSDINIGDGCASGCTDETACNFDPDATISLDVCEYPLEGLDCNGACLEGDSYVLTLGDDYGDGWNGGTLTINDVTYTQANTQSGSSQYEEESFTLCLDASLCYDVIYTPGSWSSENSWSISDLSGNVLVSVGPASGQFGDCGVYGCMDPDATNYNVDATIEDGTCTYPISMAVELDFTHSSGICGYANDYDESNTAYDPVGTSYMGNDDMAYFFTAENGAVEVSMIQGEGVTAQPGVFVFDGDPLAEGTSLIESETGSSGGDVSLTFESSDTATYYVVLDATATYGCLTSFDLTITQIFLGCTDSLATNYDPNATDDDGSCLFDFVYGCPDELACNYTDTTVTVVDDESCFYPASDLVDCDGNCLYSQVTVTMTDSDIDGTLASISLNGQELFTGVGSTTTGCIDLEGCATFVYNSNGEAWPSENSWTVDINGEEVISAGGSEYPFFAPNESFTNTVLYGPACDVAGCTDEAACAMMRTHKSITVYVLMKKKVMTVMVTV